MGGGGNNRGCCLLACFLGKDQGEGVRVIKDSFFLGWNFGSVFWLQDKGYSRFDPPTHCFGLFSFRSIATVALSLPMKKKDKEDWKNAELILLLTGLRSR